MPLWVFKCFLSESGRDLIDEWYQDLPPGARAKFDTILEHLRDTPGAEWRRPLVSSLTDSDGIYEIRFRVKNVLHRPLGFFGPNRQEFTILVPAREQGNRFRPRGAKELAEARKQIVLSNKERARECGF